MAMELSPNMGAMELSPNMGAGLKKFGTNCGVFSGHFWML